MGVAQEGGGGVNEGSLEGPPRTGVDRPLFQIPDLKRVWGVFGGVFDKQGRIGGQSGTNRRLIRDESGAKHRLDPLKYRTDDQRIKRAD